MATHPLAIPQKCMVNATCYHCSVNPQTVPHGKLQLPCKPASRRRGRISSSTPIVPHKQWYKTPSHADLTSNGTRRRINIWEAMTGSHVRASKCVRGWGNRTSKLEQGSRKTKREEEKGRRGEEEKRRETTRMDLLPPTRQGPQREEKTRSVCKDNQGGRTMDEQRTRDMGPRDPRPGEPWRKRKKEKHTLLERGTRFSAGESFRQDIGPKAQHGR